MQEQPQEITTEELKELIKPNEPIFEVEKDKGNIDLDLAKIKETIIEEIPKLVRPSLSLMATRDNQIMRLLRVGEIKHLIAHTDKGDFCLCLKKDEGVSKYRFVLDAVPVEEKENKELLDIFNRILYNL